MKKKLLKTEHRSEDFLNELEHIYKRLKTYDYKQDKIENRKENSCTLNVILGDNYSFSHEEINRNQVYIPLFIFLIYLYRL